MNNFGTLHKLFRYFSTKSRFDITSKALDANNDSYLDHEGNIVYGTPEIKWQDICFIENWNLTSYLSTKKIYTHGQFYPCCDNETITLSYALENNVHGLADALDVAQTIKDIGKNATVENVIDVLDNEE
jgi:hypothetical protein